MSLLRPGDRTLLSSIVSPPAGYRLDRGLATTYSLDLMTLLPIPVTMALSDAADPDEVARNPVALLQAIESTSDRLAIFTQQGRIKAGEGVPQLCGLLESSVYEVVARDGGAFHAKLWLLRFSPREGRDASRLRLAVLSRNLTDDRAWDVSLALDGVPGDADNADNAELTVFLRDLPPLIADSDRRRDLSWVADLAQEAGRTQWERPPGFYRLRFKHFGLGGAHWRVPFGERLVVFSPFLGENALSQLLARGYDEVHLVSRSEELAEIPVDTLERFASCRVLDEGTQSDDGEDVDGLEARERASPLHAKLYAVDNGKTLHLLLGSANATDPALVSGANVEFLAHLTGWAPRTGSAASLLDPEGFGALLADFHPALVEGTEAQSEQRALERKLEAARDRIIAARPELTWTAGDGEVPRVDLAFRAPPRLDGVEARAWLATQTRQNARSLAGLSENGTLRLAPASAAGITRFLCFEVTLPGAGEDAPRLAFGLRVPVRGLPEDRKAAIFRAIITDRRRFLEYIRLVLGDLGLTELMEASGRGGEWHVFGAGADDETPLLEHMLRALAHDPRRLDAIRSAVAYLSVPAGQESAEGHAAVVPPDFLRIWSAFEEARARR